MSDAFIREVDEDLRQKQINNLWKKYGKFIIGIAFGIVLLVSGRALYSSFVESKYIELKPATPDIQAINAMYDDLGIGTALRRQAERIKDQLD